MESAGQVLDKASALPGTSRHDGAADRDRSYLRAWKAWVAGDLRGAFDAVVQYLDRHPSDLFALKRAQLFAFLAGDAGAQRGCLRCGRAVGGAATPHRIQSLLPPSSRRPPCSRHACRGAGQPG